MDDEATIRVTLIICGSIIVVVLILVFGIGYATDHGPPSAESQAEAQILQGAAKGCELLPVADRASCLTTVARAPSLSAGVNVCSSLADDGAIDACMSAVFSGQPIADRAVALAVCSKISQNDSGLIQCVTNALRSGRVKS